MTTQQQINNLRKDIPTWNEKLAREADARLERQSRIDNQATRYGTIRWLMDAGMHDLALALNKI